MTQTREHLQNIVYEAEELLSKNERIHNMHGAYYGIRGWLSREDMTKVNWDNVNLLITKMRICNATGKYPTQDEMKKFI